MLLFRDDKAMTDEQKAWELWHSRQHSTKQRILDIGEQTTDVHYNYNHIRYLQ